MAVTQFQQYLADKAQTPMDNTECCLSMGGTVDVVNDTCILNNNEIDLIDSCAHAQEVAELTPDAVNQQSGGGFGSWITSNAETVGTLIGSIGGLFGLGTPSPPPAPSGLNEPAQDEGKKTLLAVAVAILVVVVAILLIRKSRK